MLLERLLRVAGIPVERHARSLARRFLAETEQTPEVQARRLRELIARNADSQFGRDHHFAEIRTAADFRKRVPIRGYDGHEPYIERVRQGDTRALFGPGTDILMFALTSGTTARPKTIPVTREALNNYRDGWTIWGILAFDSHPKILNPILRPILQLVSDWRETTTPSGTPCGAITGLTAAMQSSFVRFVYCMPPATMRIKDIEAKYYTALRLSVFRHLGAIMAANPSTLLAIARLGDREKEGLIRDIHDGTIDRRWAIPDDVRSTLGVAARLPRRRAARRLEEIVSRTGRLLPRDYWPDLCFLGNWTGGVMGAYLRAFPEVFGARPVRDPGLIASEGRFTIPVEDGTPSGVLDIHHHYFEFIPEDQIHRDDPETVEAHELTEGRNYYILPTTAGGLYRYHIQDVVRCAGFHGRAPALEFLNKGAHISSLTGEKLTEYQVVAALREVQAALSLPLGSFLMLPTWGDPPHYSLLVEANDLSSPDQAERLALAVDTALGRLNVEYENKRQTLRLGPVRARCVETGSWREFQRRRLTKSGGTVEQYKQPCLLPDLDAARDFRFQDGSWEASQRLGA